MKIKHLKLDLAQTVCYPFWFPWSGCLGVMREAFKKKLKLQPHFNAQLKPVSITGKTTASAVISSCLSLGGSFFSKMQLDNLGAVWDPPFASSLLNIWSVMSLSAFSDVFELGSSFHS